MDELKNPYRPGAGAKPPALLGRDQLISQFGVIVRRAAAGRPGKSLMPTGLRGVGKTVLLNRFAEIARDDGWSKVFIEAPEGKDFRALLAAHLRKCLLDLRARSATGAVLRALRVLRAFSLRIPDGPTVVIDVDPLIGQADSGLIADEHRCRVDGGGCPPRPPTDPDVQVSRIRLSGIMDSLHDGRPNARLVLEAVGSV